MDVPYAQRSYSLLFGRRRVTPTFINRKNLDMELDGPQCSAFESSSVIRYAPFQFRGPLSASDTPFPIVVDVYEPLTIMTSHCASIHQSGKLYNLTGFDQAAGARP